MPTERNEDFKLASGHNVNLSGSTYLWRTRTIPSDASDIITEWLPPEAPFYVPRPAGVDFALDGTGYKAGLYLFEWRFGYWTFGQTSDVMDDFFNSTEETGLVSVQTYDFTDTAIILNATAHLALSEMERAVGGWTNVILRFFNAEIA